MHYPTIAAGFPGILTRVLLALLCIACLATVGSTPAAAGPIGWNAFGGWYDPSGADDFLVGAGVRIGAGGLSVNPNAEWIMVESGSAYTLNLDGTFPILPLGVASCWIGGGLGLITFDPENGDSNTDTGVNLLVGVGFNAVPLKPYAQLKYVFEDGDDPLVLSIGARF